MGEVVAAILTTHVPRLMITDLAARKAYMGKNVTTFYDGMPQLERERLRDLEFDTFVLIDTHWFTTLEYILNAHERLAGVYTSEELPQMLHDLKYDYPRRSRTRERDCPKRAVAQDARGRIGGAKSPAPLPDPQRDVLFQSRAAAPGAIDERVPDRLGAE